MCVPVEALHLLPVLKQTLQQLQAAHNPADMKQCAMKKDSTSSLLVNTYDIRAHNILLMYSGNMSGNTQIAAMTFDLESNGEMDNYFSSKLIKSLPLYMTSMQTHVSNVHQTTNMAEKCKRLGVSSATPTLGMMSWSVWILFG